MSGATFSETELIAVENFEFFKKMKKSWIHFFLKDFG